MRRYVEKPGFRRLKLLMAHQRVKVAVAAIPTTVISLVQSFVKHLSINDQLRQVHQAFFRGAQTHLEFVILERADKTLHPLQLRSEEHTSELQSPCNLVCRLLLEKKHQQTRHH